MYPVGVLFGLGEPTSRFPLCNVNESVSDCKFMVSGFDTASSIALLAVSAIAKKGHNGKSIPNSQIIILPVLGPSFGIIKDKESLTFSFFPFVQSSFSLQG